VAEANERGGSDNPSVMGRHMLTAEQHLDNLVRHIELVRDACLLLGKRLIARDRQELGRILIAHGFTHDTSKFQGIEWEYLHAGRDVPQDCLELAMKHHTRTNPHHPEYWGGFEKMPEVYIAEMVCDWYARAMEFGNGLRDWIANTAIERFQIDTKGERYQWLTGFVDVLLEDQFAR